MKEGISLRYYCEKCKSFQWMRLETPIDQLPYTLRCTECKTRYENVESGKSGNAAS